MELHGNNSTVKIGRAISLPNGIVTEEKLSADLKIKIDGKEDKANKVGDIWTNAGDENAYPNAPSVATALMEIAQVKEDIANRVGDLSEATSPDQYPSIGAILQNNMVFEGYLGDKEDISNKVSEIVEDVSPEEKASAYPNMGATIDFVDGKIGWAKITDGTLTNDVQMFSPYVDGAYKRLFVSILVPTLNPINENPAFSKARIQLKAQDNIMIYDDGSNTYYTDNGNTWAVTFDISMIGNRAVTMRKTTTSTTSIYSEYIIGDNALIQQNRGQYVPDGYIDVLAITLMPSSTRYFPAGTKYEVWGVKA